MIYHISVSSIISALQWMQHIRWYSTLADWLRWIKSKLIEKAFMDIWLFTDLIELNIDWFIKIEMYVATTRTLSHHAEHMADVCTGRVNAPIQAHHTAHCSLFSFGQNFIDMSQIKCYMFYWPTAEYHVGVCAAPRCAEKRTTCCIYFSRVLWAGLIGNRLFALSWDFTGQWCLMHLVWKDPKWL